MTGPCPGQGGARMAAAPELSGEATVTLNDGTVSVYDTDKPIHLYRLSQVYDVGDEKATTGQNIQRGMMIVWAAAGMPYLNGSKSQDDAVAAMERWLTDDVAKIDRQVGDGPPANRQQRRQRSRKSHA